MIMDKQQHIVNTVASTRRQEVADQTAEDVKKEMQKSIKTVFYETKKKMSIVYDYGLSLRFVDLVN